MFGKGRHMIRAKSKATPKFLIENTPVQSCKVKLIHLSDPYVLSPLGFTPNTC